MDGSLPTPTSPPAALLELIINILNAYVKAEVKQHDMLVEGSGDSARLTPDPSRIHARVSGGNGATDSPSPFASARSTVSSSDGSMMSRPVSTRMSVEGAVGAVRASVGGVASAGALRVGGEGGLKADAITPSARFAAAVEAMPPVAVSCAAALRALGGPQGRCWGTSVEELEDEGGDAARWNLFLVCCPPVFWNYLCTRNHTRFRVCFIHQRECMHHVYSLIACVSWGLITHGEYAAAASNQFGRASG